MRKRIIFVLLLIILVLFITIYFILNGRNDMNYNNLIQASDVITCKYSSNDILNLKKDITNNNINFDDLKSEFKIQCLRKTCQGYYIVFLEENNNLVFVFLDNDLIPIKLFVFDTFKTNIDFDFVEAGKTKMSEILTFDSNSITFPISSITMTAHLTKEGIVLIKYDRLHEGNLLNDPIVNSIQYITNDNIGDDELIKKNVPFILEIDKQNR